jgi:hypothetical protein
LILDRLEFLGAGGNGLVETTIDVFDVEKNTDP